MVLQFESRKLNLCTMQTWVATVTHSQMCLYVLQSFFVRRVAIASAARLHTVSAVRRLPCSLIDLQRFAEWAIFVLRDIVFHL